MILVRVDLITLSRNMLFYLDYGRSLGFFNLFPTCLSKNWTTIPAWGLGTVVLSNVPLLPTGMSLYGIYPYSQSGYVLLRPGHFSSMTFIDSEERRREFLPYYNMYIMKSLSHQGNDWPALSSHVSDECLVIYRTLFDVAYSISAWMEDNQYLSSDIYIVSSASSRTAYALVFLLRRQHRKLKLIALTSVKHVQFVKDLHLYDEVLSYGEVQRLSRWRNASIAYVDFAANLPVRRYIEALPRFEMLMNVGATNGYSGHFSSAYDMISATEDNENERQDTVYGINYMLSVITKSNVSFARLRKCFNPLFDCFCLWISKRVAYKEAKLAAGYLEVLRSPSPDTAIIFRRQESAEEFI